jgi:hypothetical protein
MTVENYLAEAVALATAGIIVFSAASVMFLYSLLVAVLSFTAAAELNVVPTKLDHLNTGALLILFGAIYVFIIVIGMAGWMRSRLAGILTTAFAVISVCMITYAISRVISLFM